MTRISDPIQYLYNLWEPLKQKAYGKEIIFIIPPSFMSELSKHINDNMPFTSFRMNNTRGTVKEIFNSKIYLSQDADVPTAILISSKIEKVYFKEPQI